MFRAAERQKPLIASINMGRSYVIDSRGNIADESSHIGPDLLTGSVVLSGKNTWYNVVGDTPFLVFLLVLSLIYIFRKNK